MTSEDYTTALEELQRQLLKQHQWIDALQKRLEAELVKIGNTLHEMDAAIGHLDDRLAIQESFHGRAAGKRVD